MRSAKPAIVLLSVALVAALIGHVTIDVLGDFMLAHDTYDDTNHSSRLVVALVTLGLALLGIGLGLRAAIREARGSENAFCTALRAALPRNVPAFMGEAVVLSLLALCLMETCDAWVAGYAIDDIGDLFGGSAIFGGSIETLVAFAVGLLALGGLRRLARIRIIAGALGAFLRRRVDRSAATEIQFDPPVGLLFHVHYACRRIAGRAPPLHKHVSTR